MVNTAQTIQLWCWSSSSTVESWVVTTLRFFFFFFFFFWIQFYSPNREAIRL